jgi:4-amino-4-deoxy-L-arabinose transferase-like glycosyltransferase
MLVVAWAREKVARPAGESAPLEGRPDAEVSTDWRLPLWGEIAVVVGMCLIGLLFRIYRLDYLLWGMHGDEGEAATNAFSILKGEPISPFTTGWYAQPNVYYWAIAIGMKIFGQSIFGLRMSPVFFGMLALPFFYLLVRQMFGVRAAVLALGLFVGNAIFLQYSRMQFSNVTTPVFWVIGFYFLMRGLQSRRVLDFALSAFTAFFGLYFYNGARLIPFLVTGLFIYMAVTQRRFLKYYWRHLVVFAVAAFLVSAPFLGYYLDHQEEMNNRSQGMVIFNNMQIMQGQYGPPQPFVLPGGQVVPLPPEAYYLWRQLTTTLSIFTYQGSRPGDSIYGFTGEPIVTPIESALLVLGIAYAAWRWRDARFALLSIWFWGTVIAGGVLTTDAPYTPRIVGMIPTLPIFVMLPANKIIAEGVALWRSLPWAGKKVMFARLKLPDAWVQIALVCAIAIGLGYWNINNYFGKYLPNRWHYESGAATIGQTMLLQDRGPAYKFYEIGEYRALTLNNGTSRFMLMAYDIDGRDLTNLGDNLPFWDSKGKDVTFIFNNNMTSHLATVRAYYPEGDLENYGVYNTPQAFIYYTIPKEKIAAKQVTNLTYSSPDGEVKLSAKTPGIGTQYSPPPPGVSYPVVARWSGGLFAHEYAIYELRLQAPEGSSLKIDGREVLKAEGQAAVEGAVILARGLHRFNLEAKMSDSLERVSLEWRSGDPGATSKKWTTPSGVYLWDGPMGALLGEVYPFQADAVTGGLNVPLVGDDDSGAMSRRLDNALDWRDVGGFGDPTGRDWLSRTPITVRWTGSFVAGQTGDYSFSTFSNGDSGVWIDGQPVVLNTGEAARPANMATANPITLEAGLHTIEVRYNWENLDGALIVYMTPPGGQERIVMNGTMFGESSGVWLPGEVPDPPPSVVPMSLDGKE